MSKPNWALGVVMLPAARAADWASRRPVAIPRTAAVTRAAARPRDGINMAHVNWCPPPAASCRIALTSGTRVGDQSAALGRRSTMKHVLVGVLVLGAGSLGLSAQAPPAGKAATAAGAKATVKLAPTANQTARGEVTFTAEPG